MSETSQKQIKANQENGKKGGVKTEEGKAVSKYNAIKHGILKQVVSDYEKDFYDGIVEQLEDQFHPVGVFEEILVDRIGIYYLKLYRVGKAENEYMRAILNPRVTKVEDEMEMYLSTSKVVVVNEGYVPKIDSDDVEKLSDVYARYETAIENRLYKALHELQRLQASRNGENVPPPIALDVNVSGEKENGFVS